MSGVLKEKRPERKLQLYAAKLERLVEERTRELKIAEEKCRRLSEESQVVNNINKIIASSLDIRDVYKAICNELSKVIGFDRLSITILDERMDKLVTFALARDYGLTKIEKGSQYPLAGSLAGKIIMESKEPVIVYDTRDGNYHTDKILFKEGIRSRLLYPLKYKNRIVGTINFGSKKPKYFSENQFGVIGQIAPQLAIAIDNTRLFERIKESEENYRNLVEGMDDIIFRMDRQGRYLFLNNALKNVTGYSPSDLYQNPAIGHNMVHPDDIKTVKKESEKILSVRKKVSKNIEYRIICKKGKEIWVSQNTYPVKNAKGKIVGVEGTIRDIDEKKKIEEQIRRSERLASIGELAAFIAHEIRNPLAAISNSVGILKRDLKLSGDDKTLLDVVIEESERLNNIITDFLNFSQPVRFVFTKNDIREVIDDTVFLLEQDGRFKSNIEINKIYEDNLPKVSMDLDWIRKVFWNLLVNAMEAMAAGGQITIDVKKSSLGNRKAVQISTTDTGNGIPLSEFDKIYQPFYTTKSTGTGLGLAIVHRVIEGHKGTINVKSKVNEGTTFTMKLPVDNKQSLVYKNKR